MIANALSRRFEERTNVAITTIVLDWLQVTTNYELVDWSRGKLEQLIIDSSNRPGYTLVNGLIWFHGRLVIGDCDQLKDKILQSLHGSPLGGHSGIRNTYHKVKQLFYWPHLKKNVMDFALACDVCQCCKHETVAVPGLLQPLATPVQAWTSIPVDFVKGPPKSEGKDCILVVVD